MIKNFKFIYILLLAVTFLTPGLANAKRSYGILKVVKGDVKILLNVDALFSHGEFRLLKGSAAGVA